MSRIETVNPAQATGKAKELLDGVQAKLGMTPNMMRVMANSPAVLDAYLKFSGALAAGELSAKQREQIALAVGETNSCEYCLSAHTAIGKMSGLTADQILDARRGKADDAKSGAILAFANLVVEKRGFVSDAEIAAARESGVNDAEIVEAVANVALNVLTNYTNHVSQTKVDFPAVEPLPAESSTESCGCPTTAGSVA
ncbi:MAG: carboxymuconolactone decarboxylase family protein [Rhodopirellula sp. JB055]|uniref:carboxymuconolactone decarboxylase family protein n=1 Tax=Rhodopirellula sp. JB055 TaxID=3342846 RepID=UPI003709D8A8